MTKQMNIDWLFYGLGFVSIHAIIFYLTVVLPKQLTEGSSEEEETKTSQTRTNEALLSLQNKPDNDIEALSTYFRDVLFRKKPLLWLNHSSSHSEDVEYLLFKRTANNWVIHLMKNNEVLMTCLICKEQSYRIQTIDFKEFPANKRFLARGFFEHVVHHAMFKAWVEKERMYEQGILHPSQNTQIHSFHKRYERLKERSEWILLYDAFLSAESKHHIETHLIEGGQNLLTHYTSLSVTSQDDIENELMQMFDKMEQSLDAYYDAYERNQTREFRQQLRIMDHHLSEKI